ncbi:MFS transporter [Streptomyces viridochromogenes]|uniref:Putative Major facilitator superfamily MFS-1 n=1 Tax=Streptomyces viridochromogenes Tue57 TaxID=1160705 RepID=L8PJV6_STRVR|nr:MFS transporter [Streptomyces viridochromogenes]ELS56298.1 putative Major facilitator superfamily MFS-1 [Streptomyces viridochromogenes Tue57]
MTEKRTSLWRHADFRNLWLGLTASMFGAKVMAVALPLIAAVSLNTSPFEMGLLVAAETLPYLFVSLFAGVWLDRSAKRPILVLTDVVRAAVLLVVPIGWAADFLSFPLLLTISLAVGVCTVVSDIGSASYLPLLVERKDLIEGNSKLELSGSVADIGGNALGGGILQIVSAPFAVIINSATYLVSAVFTLLIRHREAPPAQPEPADGQERVGIWREIAEGAVPVLRNKVVRTLVTATLVFNLFTLLIEPVFLIFVTRTLGLEPFYLGLIFAASGAGALVGSLLADRASQLLGVGRAMVFSLLLAGVAALLIPLATQVPKSMAPLLIVPMHFIDAVMVIVYNVNQRSLRTAVTPDRLQGRMNASIRMIVMGVSPIGAVLGGLFGGWIGAPQTLVLGAVGILLAGVVIVLSDVREVKELPDSAPVTV